MFKKIFIGLLIAILGTAAGISIYNVTANPQENTTTAAAQSDRIGGTPMNPQNSTRAPAEMRAQAAAQGYPAASETAGQYGKAAAGEQAGQNGKAAGAGQGGQAGDGVPDPQNGLSEWITVSGVVSSYAPPSLWLQTEAGQSLAVELGSLNYLNTLGLSVQEGERVSVTGFWDAKGGFTAGSLTLESSGQVFTLRDAAGRPAWAGANGNGRGGRP